MRVLLDCIIDLKMENDQHVQKIHVCQLVGTIGQCTQGRIELNSGARSFYGRVIYVRASTILMVFFIESADFNVF